MATVRGLLEKALYQSIADREFSPIESDDAYMSMALDYLCLVLRSYKDDIPYAQETTFVSIDDLSNVQFARITHMDYVLGNVVYPLRQCNQVEFSLKNQVVDLNAIPEWYYHEQATGAIKVYPNPSPGVSSENYFRVGYYPLIATTDLNAPLPSAITAGMETFLIYEVAKHICLEKNKAWSTTKETMRAEAYKLLKRNKENNIAPPCKPILKYGRRRTPIIAYLSGNTP